MKKQKKTLTVGKGKTPGAENGYTLGKKEFFRILIFLAGKC
jgi:hypothetical protein